MKKIHLIWIIPLILILGFALGFRIASSAINILVDTIEQVGECSLGAMSYATEKSSDCGILITGYLANCTDIP